MSIADNVSQLIHLPAMSRALASDFPIVIGEIFAVGQLREEFRRRRIGTSDSGEHAEEQIVLTGRVKRLEIGHNVRQALPDNLSAVARPEKRPHHSREMFQDEFRQGRCELLDRVRSVVDGKCGEDLALSISEAPGRNLVWHGFKAKVRCPLNAVEQRSDALCGSETDNLFRNQVRRDAPRLKLPIEGSRVPELRFRADEFAATQNG